MQIQKSLSLEDHLWEEIDHKKGDISRSRFVEKIVRSKLKQIQEEKKS